MKEKLKKGMVCKGLAVLSMAVLVMVCGCGDADAGNGGVVNVVENIPEGEMEDGFGKEGEDVGKREGEGMGVEDRISSGEGDISDSEGKGDVGNGEASGEEEKGNGESGEPGEGLEDSIIWDDVTGEGIKTVHGNVKSIDNGSFTIIQALTGTIEGGKGDIMVVGSEDDEESNPITIKYSDETKFTVKTITDGGITSTDRPGSKEELKKDSSVTLTGSWEKEMEIFLADEIVIFIVA